jgi:hypothetical protein
MLSFDGPGSTSTSAEAIGAGKVIAGEYYDNNEALHGFIRSP